MRWYWVVGLLCSVLLFGLSGCSKKKSKGGDLAGVGQDLFTNKGCVACHSTDGTKRPGPTLKGVFGKKRVVLVAGKEQTVTADEAYLKRSMTKPDLEKVKGFEKTKMITVPLTSDDVDALVAYIKTLK